MVRQFVNFIVVVIPVVIFVYILEVAIIVVHEGGHFATCRITGHYVEKVVIGDGPLLFQWEDLNETKFEFRVLAWLGRSELSEKYGNVGGFVQRDCEHIQFVESSPFYYHIDCPNLFVMSSSGMLATIAMSSLFLLAALVINRRRKLFGDHHDVVVFVVAILSMSFAANSALYSLDLHFGDAETIYGLSHSALGAIRTTGWALGLASVFLMVVACRQHVRSRQF